MERPEEEGAAAVAEEEEDLDFVSGILQPNLNPYHSDRRLVKGGDDLDYVGFRRFLIQQLSPRAIAHRKGWRCGERGAGYVAYRNFIRTPKDRSHVSSLSNTPDDSGRWQSPPSLQSILLEVDSSTSSRDFRVNSNVSRRTSFGSGFSGVECTGRFIEPAYSFVGMHCIFDGCKSSVTILKFGHASSDLLAYGASDGSLTVCDVSEPPSVLQQLRGHTKDITDFDFSSNNQYIASTSMDKTVRVWEISKGHCMRVIYGVSSQLCIRFHPVNNNLLTIGNANREITAVNFSTGRVVHKALFDKEITAMDNDHTGQVIFAGDAQGCMYAVNVNSHNGLLSKTHRHRSSSKCPITTIQYRIFSVSTRGPVLLVCAQDGNLSFFSVALEVQGYLTPCCTLKLASRVHRILASFCPLLSLEKGEFIVSGSEDSNVYFYDLTRPKNACVNKLQGHGAPVIGVAWNHGENLLASSDSDGTVIVWKRAKMTG